MLLLELLLTRIFSVVMFHHLSFVAVSLAMTGLGFGGLLVNAVSGRFRRDNLASAASFWATVFAIGTVAAGAVAFHMPIGMETSAENWLKVLTVLGFCLVPFAAGGIIIAHLLSCHAQQTNRLYCFDLVGAGFGCLAFIPMTNWLGAPTALLFTSAAAVVAGFVLAGPAAPRRRAVCLTVFAIIVGTASANLVFEFYDIKYAHGGRQGEALERRWNSFSRVEVAGTAPDLWTKRAPVSFGYSHTIQGKQARELYLTYDAGALTQIVGFRGDLAEVDYLHYDVASAAYHTRPQGSVLVIGAGGGRDVLTALSAGAQHVTGVEINGLTIDLLRGPFKDFVGGLYSDYPRVDIVHDDGRSYVRSTQRKYDLIQASLVDTWAASSAGAFALVENSLYTVDAFSDYLSRLAPQGMLSFSRWYRQPPEEVLRVVVLGKEALRRRGVADARKNLAIVRTRTELTKAPSLATIIFKLSPFDPGECDELLAWANRMQFAVEYLPPASGWRGNNPVIATVMGPQSERFIARAAYDLSLVDDNRPFFFDRVPLLAWLMHRFHMNTISAGAGQLTFGGQTLLIALVATATCAFALFLTPLLLAGWAGRRVTKTLPEAGAPTLGRSIGWAVYFACLGLGFMAIEIVLIQRFNLHLGDPVYALSVVMFTMLLSSGLGSHVAGRCRTVLTLPVILTLVLGLLVLYGFALPRIIHITLGASTARRIVVAMATIAPIAFIMGMPFPTGMRLAAKESNSLVSWAWAINGGASVFGSVLTVLISMSFGFSSSFLVGTFIYGMALTCIVLLAPASQEGAPKTAIF
ncbi:MAG: hypothetical protein ABSF35_10600 [Polyangia bacterium]